MQKWKKFEHLVARIHQALDASSFEFEHDVDVAELSGTTHQVDVLLRPKSSFTGPVLVSCKDRKERVGMTHVREWSDIVAHTGAAAGVIVARAGFASGACDLAKEPSRRISLWIPRPLIEEDFAPDEQSPEEYIVIEHRVKVDVDLTQSAFAYENVLTGELKIVPLPASLLRTIS